ncbi:MAG: fumarylacetoacetate hydrolase family protein [Gammaproteobacteria bacterium]|nr:fumarylacetoacetate hydrolase family protein [Gammaproteobacteria bacterium]
MKLATIKASSKDGNLAVVSKDLKRAILVPSIASTMQYALDNWQKLEPKLQEAYAQLNLGKVEGQFEFNEKAALSPLPRAYQFADASAYVNHVELVRKARGVIMPESFWHEPLFYQASSDKFLAPHENIPVKELSWGADFEAEIAVITDEVPLGATKAEAIPHIKLLMLVNDVSLRNLIPDELAKGFGFFQSKPASAFSPVAVTPDELGLAWDDQRVHLPLMVHFNTNLFGQPNAGVDMVFNFAELIAHVAKTRYLGAGSIIGSGTVSNYDKSLGSCCIVEKRMLEIIKDGAAITPYMQYGDNVRIEMFDQSGQSIFGAIDQKVVPY